jgi:hypothetical protein
LNKDIEAGSEESHSVEGSRKYKHRRYYPRTNIRRGRKKIKIAKNNKAPGIDLVTVEMIK